MQAFIARQFAKSSATPNTFIGGIAKTGGTGANAPIDTPYKLSQKLGIDVNRITGFRVVGDDVECRIRGSYVLDGANADFNNNKNITSYIDDDGLLSTILTSAMFQSATNLTDIYMPSLVSIPLNTFRASGVTSVPQNAVAFGQNSFFGCLGLVNVFSDNVVNLNGVVFYNCSNAKTFILNKANVITNSVFALCSSVELIEIKKCKAMTNASEANVFTNIKIGCLIKTNIFLYTSNAGAPNPSLVYAKEVRGATVEFYDDNGDYVLTL